MMHSRKACLSRTQGVWLRDMLGLRGGVCPPLFTEKDCSEIGFCNDLMKGVYIFTFDVS